MTTVVDPARTSRGHRAPGTAGDSHEPTLGGVLGAVLRERGLVLRCMLLFALPTAVIGLLRPRTYTSTASFMEQERTDVAGLGGLAARFGVTIPGTSGGNSPEFYGTLLKSRTLLRAVVDSSVTYTEADTSVTARLSDVLVEDDNLTPAERREEAVKALLNGLTVEVNPTSEVSFQVTSGHATLSTAIARRLLEAVDAFNAYQRRSRAEAERRFTEARVAGAQAELRATEDTLLRFLQRNRVYRNSPELTVIFERLTRAVDLKQQVYAALAQAYEQARIDEVRDTPVVSVVERPVDAVRPDSRRVVLLTLVALIVGFFVGTLLVLLRDSVGLRPAADGDPPIHTLWRDTLRDLRSPIRVARLVLGRRG